MSEFDLAREPPGLGHGDEGHRNVANVTGRPGSPQRTHTENEK